MKTSPAFVIFEMMAVKLAYFLKLSGETVSYTTCFIPFTGGTSVWDTNWKV